MRMFGKFAALFIIALTSLLLTPAILNAHSRSIGGPGPSAGSLTASPAPANVVQPVTTTTLSNDPNSPNWTIDSPTWKLQNGYLDGNGTSPNPLSPKIISSPSFSSNRSVQVSFRTVTPGPLSHYVAWVIGKYDDFYDKAVLVLHTGDVIELAVTYGTGGISADHFVANSTLDPTHWHTAKEIFSGNTATVYIDGKLYINATDPLIGDLGDSPISLASWGPSESQFTNITVTGSVLSDELPKAIFTASPQPAAPGQQVLFDGSYSNDIDGYIANWAWNFGDGTSANGPYTYHTYNVAGNYTVTLIVTDTGGQVGSVSHHVVIVAPSIVVTPQSGPIGTKVLVHGTNFPSSGGFPTGIPTTIDVTFDDQFVGFTTTANSTFTFVFNVPIAQLGPHEIHAYAQVYPSPIETTASFTVTAQPTGGTSLTVTTAAIYFPGDTATFFVLSTLNGTPTPAPTISLSLILQNGTARSLNLVLVTPGYYRATYKIPSTGSVGTYGLLAASSINGTNSAATTSFEVKPTWLQANGHTVLTASGIAGVIGSLSILGVAWRKGYFTRKEDDLQVA